MATIVALIINDQNMITQIKNDFTKIQQVYHLLNAEGIINIHFSTQKEMSYSPLHDELAFETSQSVGTRVVFIKNHKKASYSIDGYTLERVLDAIDALAKTVEMSEYDVDIMLPEVRDE